MAKRKKKKSLVPAFILIALGFGLLNAKPVEEPDDVIRPDPSYKDKWDKTIKLVSASFGLSNWLWLKALIGVESDYGRSSFVVNKILGTGRKRGILGITENTFSYLNSKYFNSIHKPDDLWIPEVSIKFGGRLLKENYDFFGGDIKKGVMAYNVGAGNVKSGNYIDKARAYYTRWNSELNSLTGRGV
ncbi:MAG: lytic transglycosylase domain-containing protein [Leptospiraceae bacterium]|nr:lytic transglycosylase domain-containing protein [Leptospiraceae bacterium]MCP5501895.1 lytic transglycosylase domain-containing protein [Leptospiraceae bacterium]